ncbi:MAG: Rpn family recombination-promoting nuclease/putative transposase [Sulfurimicrobium sp.]|nr:Rpn family recombination-promoting nuclease/putative transposase [Sulfurimicrobium sp.]
MMQFQNVVPTRWYCPILSLRAINGDDCHQAERYYGGSSAAEPTNPTLRYNPPMAHDHDTGYKLLFSHPEMVRDLLVGYVAGEWIDEADFTTLERINASYVSATLKQRHDDVVWRVKLKDRWLWVYLVLEFQSEPDPWMALRMLVYVGLLAQDLVKRGELAQGQLPPILPLVLYNGLPEWNAARDINDLFAPSPRGLEAYRPRMIYHLTDEARLKLHPTESVRNATEALFRLEHGSTPDDLRRVIQALGHMLQDPELEELRRSFTVWIKSLLRRKTPASASEIEQINDLMEADTMLAERMESWFEEATRKGVQQGVQQGMQQGEGLLLQRQLTRRFGALPADIVARLAGASLEQLESWGDQVLDAKSLDELFGEQNPH